MGKNNWTYQPLSKLCDINIGKTPSRSKEEFWGEGHTWVSISDMKSKIITQTKEEITDLALSKTNIRKVKEGTLLMSFKLSIGKLAFAGQDLYTNEAIVALPIKKNVELDKNYLYYALGFIPLTGGNQAAMGKTLNKKSLAALSIPLPPSLAHQKRIAKILSDCEALIQKRKESINLLDKLLKSTFLEMFGDPGVNPKGWQEKKLNEHIEYIGDIGSNGSNAIISKNLIMHDKENYALMVRTTNLKSNDFINKTKFFSKETYEFFSKSKIYGGEIIMNKIGSAGEFWIMPNLNRPVSLGLNQLVIRLKNINTVYLYYYFSTNYGKQVIQSQVKGAVTKSITKGAVKSLPLLFPPIEIQNEFSAIAEKMDLLKSKFNNSLSELENLYDSLSQRAFKGELDLSNINISNMENIEQEKPEMEPIGEPRKVGKAEFQDYQVYIDEIIKKDFKDISFSFKKLEAAIADRGVYVPYDNVKGFVFKSLEGNDSFLVQELNEREKQIVFRIRS